MYWIDKVAKMWKRILVLVWYGGIFVIYILALVQAFSLELTETVGIVVVLWPLVLALSVQMARENLLCSIPVLRACKIDGWGMLSFPRDWRAEGKNPLVFRDAENRLCAVICRKEQLQGEFTWNLPDGTPIRVKIPYHMPSDPDAVSRCRYTIGQNRGSGYFYAVSHGKICFVSVVFCRNYIGKYIAEQFWSETWEEAGIPIQS